MSDFQNFDFEHVEAEVDAVNSKPVPRKTKRRRSIRLMERNDLDVLPNEDYTNTDQFDVIEEMIVPKKESIDAPIRDNPISTPDLLDIHLPFETPPESQIAIKKAKKDRRKSKRRESSHFQSSQTFDVEVTNVVVGAIDIKQESCQISDTEHNAMQWESYQCTEGDFTTIRKIKTEPSTPPTLHHAVKKSRRRSSDLLSISEQNIIFSPTLMESDEDFVLPPPTTMRRSGRIRRKSIEIYRQQIEQRDEDCDFNEATDQLSMNNSEPVADNTPELDHSKEDEHLYSVITPTDNETHETNNNSDRSLEKNGKDKKKLKANKEKPVRNKRKQPLTNIEDYYLNKNYQKPKIKVYETIYEQPKIVGACETMISAKRFKRFITFEDNTTQNRLKKRRKKAKSLGWKPPTKKIREETERLLAEKMSLMCEDPELNSFLDEATLEPEKTMPLAPLYETRITPEESNCNIPTDSVTDESEDVSLQTGVPQDVDMENDSEIPQEQSYTVSDIDDRSYSDKHDNMSKELPSQYEKNRVEVDYNSNDNDTIVKCEPSHESPKSPELQRQPDNQLENTFTILESPQAMNDVTNVTSSPHLEEASENVNYETIPDSVQNIEEDHNVKQSVSEPSLYYTPKCAGQGVETIKTAATSEESTEIKPPSSIDDSDVYMTPMIRDLEIINSTETVRNKTNSSCSTSFSDFTPNSENLNESKMFDSSQDSLNDSLGLNSAVIMLNLTTPDRSVNDSLDSSGGDSMDPLSANGGSHICRRTDSLDQSDELPSGLDKMAALRLDPPPALSSAKKKARMATRCHQVTTYYFNDAADRFHNPKDTSKSGRGSTSQLRTNVTSSGKEVKSTKKPSKISTMPTTKQGHFHGDSEEVSGKQSTDGTKITQWADKLVQLVLYDSDVSCNTSDDTISESEYYERLENVNCHDSGNKVHDNNDV